LAEDPCHAEEKVSKMTPFLPSSIDLPAKTPPRGPVEAAERSDPTQSGERRDPNAQQTSTPEVLEEAAFPA
jgi:hypothetical protein